MRHELDKGRIERRGIRALAGILPVGTVAPPSCIGLQREPDTRFREAMNAWICMSRGTGQIREWMLDGLAKSGVTREQAPPAQSS